MVGRGLINVAIESENVQKLQEWFADGSPTRSAHATAEALAQRLAAMVFGGEQDWPEQAGRAAAYRDALREWFMNDGDHELQFVKLTSPDADPGVFIDWFLPVLGTRESRAPHVDAGTAQGAGQGSPGWPNPNHDGTPGTEYYRFDEATRQHVYAADADAGEWVTYERRRYTEPTRNEDYALDCRYDRRDGVYEWYDEATATWRNQAWATQRTAAAAAPGADPSAAGPEPAWDEDWNMFYRTGSGGGYEFADAVTPGVRSSGCGGTWLAQDEALAQRARRPPADGEEAHAATRADVRTAVESLLRSEPELGEGLTEEEIAEVIAEITEEQMRKASGEQGGSSSVI
jgi:hypothetical protein